MYYGYQGDGLVSASLDSKVPHLLCPCGVDIGLGRARLPLLKQLLAMLGLWEWRDTPNLSMVTIFYLFIFLLIFQIFFKHTFIPLHIHPSPFVEFPLCFFIAGPLSAERPPCGCQVSNRTWDCRSAVRRASNLATPHPKPSHAAP